MTYLVQAVTHTFCCVETTNQFMPIEGDLSNNKDSQSCFARFSCHILLLCIETGLYCHSHLLSDRCSAGNPLWQAPACYKWADTLGDSAKAKNFTISSDACAADRKMRMTPPRSFSLSPCDAHSCCTSRACTTHCLTVTGSF